MAYYLGFVEIKNGHYNFMPLYAFDPESKNFHELDDESRHALLPESRFQNVELISRDITFIDNQLLFLDFSSSDLIDNFKLFPERERNGTGYKIDLALLNDLNRINRLEDFGFYHVVFKENITGDYREGNVKVDIDEIGIGASQKVFLCFEKDSLIGPYTVLFHEGQYYVPTLADKKEYIIEGYRSTTIPIANKTIDISCNANYRDLHWNLINISDNDEKLFIDVCPDAILLQNFRESLSHGVLVDGKIDLTNIDAVLKEYKRSILIGGNIPDSIREERLKRIHKLLANEEDLQHTFDSLASALPEMLLKYKNTDTFDKFINDLLKKDTFKDNFMSFRIVQQKLDEQEKLLEDYETQLQGKQNELQSITSESDNSKIQAKFEGDISELQVRKQTLEQEISSLRAEKGIIEDVNKLASKKSFLDNEILYLDRHKTELTNECETLGHKLDGIMQGANSKMANIVFDGVIANKMIRQAAQWEEGEVEKGYAEIATAVNLLACSEKQNSELIDYLLNTIQKARPTYDRNTILNIIICISQNFLTIFSGEPGAGKTSICNIIAHVLGLNYISNVVDTAFGARARRYIPVSVERGWTSKRDFIGYFNPLTKVFDKSNRRLYDGLRILDYEKRQDYSKLPFIILLDEANLSPMEYYWADFMNICDDFDDNNYINIGAEHEFLVPETLRFVATINNDHTTETLSPRLIDRAWIVSLPQAPTDVVITDSHITNDEVEIIPWESIRSIFAPLEVEIKQMGDIEKEIYTRIRDMLKSVGIILSTRTDRAIRRYWSVAQSLFESEGSSASISALDHAISQKAIPKIAGNGEVYRKFLEDFRDYCKDKELRKSRILLDDIINKGERSMGYYRFFE